METGSIARKTDADNQPMSIQRPRHYQTTSAQFDALDDVDLEIPDGQLVALLGPSGSGKTTLLRIIAGLEFADAGTIQFDGEDISRSDRPASATSDSSSSITRSSGT